MTVAVRSSQVFRSSRQARGKSRFNLASADDPQIQEIAHQNGAYIVNITTLLSSDIFNHDRFVVFASCYAVAAQRDESVGGVRRAGVFLLDATGRTVVTACENGQNH